MRRRGRRYKNWSNRDWALWHEGKRSAVSSRFFGIDEEVTEAFYSLTPQQLTTVFRAYGARYGSGPQRYAEKAYPKWRSGDVAPSATTLERLLECVPPVLPLSEKAKLIAQLRLRSRKPGRARITCSLDDADRIVSGALRQLLSTVAQHEIPSNVRNALSWLSSDSVRATEQILHASEYLEASWIAEFARLEVDRLHAVGRRLGGKGGQVHPTFSHVIDSPYGYLEIEVSSRSRGVTLFPPTTGVVMPDDLTPHRSAGLIDKLAADLTDAEKAELRSLAAREQISLESKARGAVLRHDSAKADIDRDLDALDRLQYGNSNADYVVSGNYHGASGHTKIEVRRRDPAAAAIKWAAVGAVIVVILVMLFS